MRIALHSRTDTGTRAARILLAERDLIALGLYQQEPTDRTEDRRMTALTNLTGYTVLVSDGSGDDLAMAHDAFAAGAHFVTSGASPDIQPPAELTLLSGCSLARGIGAALLRHELQRTDGVETSLLAWTEDGSSLRSGEAIPFPDPVGPRWARPAHPGDSEQRFVAPVPGEWAAVMVRLEAGGHTRIVGVSDHRAHLEGIALAAGAVAAAQEAFPAGKALPDQAAETYLAAAFRMGLSVAAHAA